MNNILDKIKIEPLKKKDTDFIVRFPSEILDLGYKFCNDVMVSLQQKFPTKTFLGIPDGLVFTSYSIEELESIKKDIQKEIDSRSKDKETIE